MSPRIGTLALLGLALSGPAWAGHQQEIQWGAMAMGLFGGLALFLFGMDLMAEALKAVAGERMKQILARLTTNRFTGALTGALLGANRNGPTSAKNNGPTRCAEVDGKSLVIM